MKMETSQIVLSRGLPKTGQVLEYEILDDGVFQAGWWVGKTVANNLTRFVVKTIDGDDVVIDRATGLMWARDCTGAGGHEGVTYSFAAQNNHANLLTFAGFSDWRVPNVKELFSIMDFSDSRPCWPDVFVNTINTAYWTSTTDPIGPTGALYIDTNSGNVAGQTKALNFNVLYVRGGV